MTNDGSSTSGGCTVQGDNGFTLNGLQMSNNIFALPQNILLEIKAGSTYLDFNITGGCVLVYVE